MSEENFTLVFDGSGVKNGEIDVQELGQSLISMGELIQSANGEINGDKSPISVKVQATSKGSFEVVLLVQSLAENVKPLLDFAQQNKDGISAANDLMDLLFKAGTAAAAPFGGLFWLIKFLKGRKPDKIEKKQNGNIHVYIDNKFIVINEKVKKLAESVPVRKRAKESISVLSHSGIDTLKVKRPATDDLEITKSEVGFFDFQEDEEELTEEVRNMTLQIVKLSFQEGNKWRMTTGGDAFNVTIEDVEFLNKVANAELAFSNGDYLECVVREKQFRTTSGLKTERFIIKVNRHTRAASQLNLI